MASGMEFMMKQVVTMLLNNPQTGEQVKQIAGFVETVGERLLEMERSQQRIEAMVRELHEATMPLERPRLLLVSES